MCSSTSKCDLRGSFPCFLPGWEMARVGKASWTSGAALLTAPQGFWLLGKILCLSNWLPSASSKGSQAVACLPCLGDLLWLSLFNFALQKTVWMCQKSRCWLWLQPATLRCARLHVPMLKCYLAVVWGSKKSLQPWSHASCPPRSHRQAGGYEIPLLVAVTVKDQFCLL